MANNPLISELRLNTDKVMELTDFNQWELASPISTGHKDTDIKRGQMLNIVKYRELMYNLYNIQSQTDMISREYINFLEEGLRLRLVAVQKHLKRRVELDEEIIGLIGEQEATIKQLTTFKQEYKDRFVADEKLINFMLPMYQELVVELDQLRKAHIRDYSRTFAKQIDKINLLFDSLPQDMKKRLTELVEKEEPAQPEVVIEKPIKKGNFRKKEEDSDEIS